MLRLVHRGIGASGSVAFCTTVGVIERSGRLRSNTIINNIHAPQGCRPALQYLSPNGDAMHRNYGLLPPHCLYINPSRNIDFGRDFILLHLEAVRHGRHVDFKQRVVPFVYLLHVEIEGFGIVAE